MATVEVESRDVVRLVLQFLKENNLSRAFSALQDETGELESGWHNAETDPKTCRGCFEHGGQHRRVCERCDEWPLGCRAALHHFSKAPGSSLAGSL